MFFGLLKVVRKSEEKIVNCLSAATEETSKTENATAMIEKHNISHAATSAKDFHG